MIRCDYHLHTKYCDGKAGPEEMVEAALAKGLSAMGFSGHAYTSRDETWCMSQENTGIYCSEIRQLREKYQDKIKILLGIEQDYFSDGCLDGFDYRIGSVHYVDIEGQLFGIDDSGEDQRRIADTYFGGDLMKLAECYYETVENVIAKTGADIIGHFNLIEKFNEGDCMYDTTSDRYKKAWQRAVDRLIPYGVPFEINTGAISRGYRSEPYPSPEMMQYIHDKGGSFILSSDSHNTGTLCYEFDRWEQYANEHGYRLLNGLNR